MKSNAHQSERDNIKNKLYLSFDVYLSAFPSFSPTWSCVSLPRPTTSSGWKLRKLRKIGEKRKQIKPVWNSRWPSPIVGLVIFACVLVCLRVGNKRSSLILENRIYHITTWPIRPLLPSVRFISLNYHSKQESFTLLLCFDNVGQCPAEHAVHFLHSRCFHLLWFSVQRMLLWHCWCIVANTRVWICTERACKL